MLVAYYSDGIDLRERVLKVNFIFQMKAEVISKSNFTFVILLFS